MEESFVKLMVHICSPLRLCLVVMDNSSLDFKGGLVLRVCP